MLELRQQQLIGLHQHIFIRYQSVLQLQDPIAIILQQFAELILHHTATVDFQASLWYFMFFAITKQMQATGKFAARFNKNRYFSSYLSREI